MSDGLKIALTAVFGVFVFAVGQILQRLFIEPIQEQRKTLGRIAHALTFYANAGPIGTEVDELKEASKHLRGLASDLRASRSAIPWYRLARWVFRLPTEGAIRTASTALIGWSNNLFSVDGGRGREDRRKTIAEALGLPLHG